MSTQASRRRGTDAPDRVPIEKRRRGRPPVFQVSMLPVVLRMARAGATDVEMCDRIGVSVDTFYTMMRDIPEFSEAVKAGKDAFDERVVHSLGRRAVGYDYTAEKAFSNGTRVQVREHIPPDVAAGFIWLKNRKRMDWKDRHETALVVDADQPPEGEQYSNRQLALAALALMSEAAYEGETIEAQANEEQDDGSESEEEQPRGRRQRRARSDTRDAASEAAPDPDFDF